MTAAPVGAREPSGFRTSQPSMMTARAPHSSFTPIMTVGERLAGGYEFEAIPDGISVRKQGGHQADIYVNHELSTVPFSNTSDFFNSILSRLRLNDDAEVLAGDYVIPSSANYQRFCSNFLAGHKQGFERRVLFTNEEASDFVNPHRPGVARRGRTRSRRESSSSMTSRRARIAPSTAWGA